MLKLKGLARARCSSVWIFAVLSLGALTVHAATATFDIEPQDLSGALKAFAVQSHREIFFAPELARGRISHGVKGKFDDLKALNYYPRRDRPQFLRHDIKCHSGPRLQQ
jgi:predicted NUDIX family NTP pyrophosphohydrolase